MHKELNTSVQYLKSVGPKRAESFREIGINTVCDLLFYLPTRYLDRSNILSSSQVIKYIANGYDGEVTIIGKVTSKSVLRYGRKQLLKVNMDDSKGSFECIWFQGIQYFKTTFNEEEIFAVSAKPVITKYGHLQFTHPDFDRIDKEESEAFQNTGKIIPFYKVPKELKATNLGDKSLRRIISHAVENYSSLLEETLPDSIIKDNNLLNICDAVKSIHFPENHEKLGNAWMRFKYEEIFAFEIMVALKRYNVKHIIPGNSLKTDVKKLKLFLSSLPFELTESQLKVLSDIRKDLESPQPMNRLLQGDVGSGKTIVSLIAMLIAIHNGYQAAMLVPTEILADQHFKTITTLLKGTGITATLLLGGIKKKDKEIILEEIRTNKINLLIGTHALLEEDVVFENIGIVVIDEQHRFGVDQRSKLIHKGKSPDVLIMTATPIPRTLTMTLYGDLDVSIIHEKPRNRKKIKTYLRSENKLPEIFKYITDKAMEGYQSFVVYPLVEESDKIDLKAAQVHYEELKETYLKTVRVGLLHGKMKWQEKEEVMLKFAAKEFDVLISTTVIEVGIDIPDANIIVINDAFRFGLSQLHQLRGRVGRSDKQAYCILVTKPEFLAKASQLEMNYSYMSSKDIDKNKSIVRLNAMINSNDGFELSEIDLKLRGPGDVFGTKQSGLPNLKHVNIYEDSELIHKAKKDAFNIVESDPSLNQPSNLIIKNNLRSNYSSHIYYSLIP